MTQVLARWRLDRAGIISLFDYADEEFVFEDGRVVLQGPNGSGKSKAIEVLFPFLLDGDMDPRKLDPFGKQSRKMQWNLLMGGKYDFRTGYVWATVVHDDPLHQPNKVTFGICLEAHKGWTEVRTRFFVIEGMQPRKDFSLISEDGRPLNREKLAELIRTIGGSDFTEAKAYRDRLNDLLSGFQTQERRQQWIRLMRLLRKPQLSDTLNEEQLNEVLSMSLPEVDLELLETNSRRLDAIEEHRRAHETLDRNTAAVHQFGETYSRYARAELRERAEGMQAALASLETTRREAAENETKLAEAEAREHDLAERLHEIEASVDRARAERDELRASPEYRTAREIEEARRQAEDLDRRLAAARDAHAAAVADRERQADRLRREQNRLDEAVAEIAVLMTRAQSVAQTAGITDHETAVAGLAGDDATSTLIGRMLRLGSGRRQTIDQAVKLREKKEMQAKIAIDRAGERTEAEERLAEARSERIHRESELVDAREALEIEIEHWLDRLTEITIDDDGRARLRETVAEAGSPQAPAFTSVIAPSYQTAVGRLEREKAIQEAALEQLRAEWRPLQAELTALEGAEDPEPTLAATRERSQDRTGAPLWQLLDWNADVNQTVRAALEGALEGAGVLDGWVMPDGTLLDGVNDVVLSPAPTDGRTLADVLTVAPGDLPVDPVVVRALLGSVGLGVAGAPFSVDETGTFRFGPVRGRHTKSRCEFIGAAARAETRRQRITAIQEQLSAIRGRADETEQKITTCVGALEKAEAELASVPRQSRCLATFQALQESRRQEETERAALDRAEARAITAEREADLSVHDLEVHCDRHGLDLVADPEKLQQTMARVLSYEEIAREMATAERDRLSALRLVDERSGDVAAADARVNGAAQTAGELEQSVNQTQGRLEALAVAAEGAQRVLDRVAELDSEIAGLTGRFKQLSQQKDEAIRATGALRAQVATQRQATAGKEMDLANALEGVRAVVRLDLLPLALERVAATPEKEEMITWDAGAWAEFLAQLPANALHSRGGRETLANDLDTKYELLQQEIDAAQLQIARERVGGLMVVRPTMNGEPHSFTSLVKELTEQVAESQARLSESDRRLFEDFVTGGLVEHLRTRILEAQLSVAKMKEFITKVEASSGMSIGINWRRRDDESPVLKQALELLQSSPARLNDQQRLSLSEFIRAQITEARLGASENETTLDQLSRALDYRSWHRFVITKANRKRGIAEHEMTKHAHEAGSGGEKAIALHLPLLAAAASYASSAREDALRLVILDEAFTRIDDEGRRGLMAMMVAFDLDVVLTSPDFWGCYEEVPGMSIYKLAPQDPDMPGVVARRFVWNGYTRREVDDEVEVAAAA